MKTLMAVSALFIIEGLWNYFIKQPLPIRWSIVFWLAVAVGFVIDTVSIVLSFVPPPDFGPTIQNTSKIGFSKAMETQTDGTSKSKSSK